ncbi:hypothetical protein [Pontimicrobium sp. MEBiC01747]
MSTQFLTWNMQGAGSGNNPILKWEQLIGYLNINNNVNYVAFQEGGQKSTYDALKAKGYAIGFQTIERKIYNRGKNPEILWQFDYFEASTDKGDNKYGVFFLSRYTKKIGEDWKETKRVSLGVLYRLPIKVTKWMFVKFGDDISDALRPPVGIIINEEFMVASLHSTARGGYNTEDLVHNVCDWFRGEGLNELYILGDFNINGLSQQTLNKWLVNYKELKGILQTVPLGGVGKKEQYTHYGDMGKNRLDYGVYIYDENNIEDTEFQFKTVYYNKEQPVFPQNQPIPNPLSPGNHNFYFKSDHRPLLFSYEDM